MVSSFRKAMFLLLLLCGSSIQSFGRSVDQLPLEMMGFWFGADSVTAELYLAPQYFKHRELDQSLSLLFDYESIIAEQGTYHVTGSVRGTEVSFSLRLENGLLYYDTESQATMVLKQLEIPAINEVREEFDAHLAPIVGKNFAEIFEGQDWGDTAWTYSIMDSVWNGSFAIARDLYIGRKFMYSKGMHWRFKAAVVNDTAAILILESIAQGLLRPVFLINQQGKRKLIDFSGEEVSFLKHREARKFGNEIPDPRHFGGTYLQTFSAFKSHIHSFRTVSIRGRHLKYQGKIWNLVGGSWNRFFYQFGSEIQMFEGDVGILKGTIQFKARGIQAYNAGESRKIRNRIYRGDVYAPLLYLYILAFVLFILLLPIFLFIRLAKSRRRNQQLQVSVLRSQLNPHFIFNAMNSIQSLVNQKEIDRTNAYLNDFARLLRSVITQTEEELIPISEELETLEQYCRLEALRSDFTCTIDVGSDIDIYSNELPPGLLQPIVENSVVHAFAIHEDPSLRIELLRDQRRLWILIVDNGPGIKEEDLYTGKGVYLVRERIKAINKTGIMKIRFKQENLDPPLSGLLTRFEFIKYF